MNKRQHISVKHLVEYFQTNEKVNKEIFGYGEDPGITIDDVHYKHLSSLDVSLQDSILQMKEKDLGTVLDAAGRNPSISQLVTLATINLDLRSQTKESLLSELASMAFRGGLACSVEGLYGQLKEREAKGTTALVDSLAIPHAHHPSKDIFRKSGVMIAVSKRGIDFQAADGKKTHLFFVPCATNEFMHIRMLVQIASFVQQPGILQKLKTAKNNQDILNMLTAS